MKVAGLAPHQVVSRAPASVRGTGLAGCVSMQTNNCQPARAARWAEETLKRTDLSALISRIVSRPGRGLPVGMPYQCQRSHWKHTGESSSGILLPLWLSVVADGPEYIEHQSAACYCPIQKLAFWSSIRFVLCHILVRDAWKTQLTRTTGQCSWGANQSLFLPLANSPPQLQLSRCVQPWSGPFRH